MKQVIISAIAALGFTAGIASADSFIGADHSLYEPKTLSIGKKTQDGVSSTFDQRFNNKENQLPSVKEQKNERTFGPR